MSVFNLHSRSLGKVFPICASSLLSGSLQALKFPDSFTALSISISDS